MKNKTPNPITLLTVAGIMCLAANTAVADSQYNVADLNNDGIVTSEEVVAYVQMNYSKINRSKNHTFNAKEAAELEEIFDLDG